MVIQWTILMASMYSNSNSKKWCKCNGSIVYFFRKIPSMMTTAVSTRQNLLRWTPWFMTKGLPSGSACSSSPYSSSQCLSNFFTFLILAVSLRLGLLFLSLSLKWWSRRSMTTKESFPYCNSQIIPVLALELWGLPIIFWPHREKTTPRSSWCYGF